MLKMWITKLWKMTAGFVLFFICNSYLLWYFFLDNLITFFLLFYEMWGYPNKWCENNTGPCVFLYFRISHIKNSGHTRHIFWYTAKMLNKMFSGLTLLFYFIYWHKRFYTNHTRNFIKFSMLEKTKTQWNCRHRLLIQQKRIFQILCS